MKIFNICKYATIAYIIICSTFSTLQAMTIPTTKKFDSSIAKAHQHPEKLEDNDIASIVYYPMDHTSAMYKKSIKVLNEPAVIKQITNIFIHNISAGNWALPYLILSYFSDSKALGTSLLPFIAENIDSINYTIVLHYISIYPSLNNQLTPKALEHITTIHPLILEQIIKQKPTCIPSLLKVVFENKETPVWTINKLLQIAHQYKVTIPAQYNIEALKLRIKIFFSKKGPLKITAATLIMFVCYKYWYGTLPYAIPSLTQTQMHIFANTIACLESPNICTYTSKPELAMMLDQITQKEKDLAAQGYITFIHAQQWKYRIIEQWYTKLWEVFTKKSAEQFLFIHCEKPINPAQLQNEKKLRNHILAYPSYDGYSRSKLLFLNYALFGNETTDKGSSSASLFLYNTDDMACQISLKDIFEMFDYNSYYQKYQQALAELVQEHASLSRYGQILVIGIPKTLLPECVYVAHPGGSKRTVDIKNIGTTDDINLIIDTLRTAPENIPDSNLLEFCLILTQDMLTPDTGIKVFGYNAADQSRLAQFDKKSNELFARIKKDILMNKKPIQCSVPTCA